MADEQLQQEIVFTSDTSPADEGLQKFMEQQEEANAKLLKVLNKQLKVDNKRLKTAKETVKEKQQEAIAGMGDRVGAAVAGVDAEKKEGQVLDDNNKKKKEGIKDGKALKKVTKSFGEILGKLAIPVGALASFAGIVALLIDADSKAEELNRSVTDLAVESGNLFDVFTVEGGRAVSKLGEFNDIFTDLSKSMAFKSIQEAVDTYAEFAKLNIPLGNVGATLDDVSGASIILGRQVPEAATFLAEGIDNLGGEVTGLIDTFDGLYDEMVLSGLGAQRFSTQIMSAATDMSFLSGQLQDVGYLLAAMGKGTTWSAQQSIKSFESLKEAGDGASEGVMMMAAQSERGAQILTDTITQQIVGGKAMGKVLAKQLGVTGKTMEDIRAQVLAGINRLAKESPIELRYVLSNLPGQRKAIAVMESIAEKQGQTLVSMMKTEQGAAIMEQMLGLDAKGIQEMRAFMQRLTDRFGSEEKASDFMTGSTAKQEEMLKSLEGISNKERQDIMAMVQNAKEAQKNRNAMMGLAERIAKFLEDHLTGIGKDVNALKIWVTGFLKEARGYTPKRYMKAVGELVASGSSRREEGLSRLEHKKFWEQRAFAMGINPAAVQGEATRAGLGPAEYTTYLQRKVLEKQAAEESKRFSSWLATMRGTEKGVVKEGDNVVQINLPGGNTVQAGASYLDSILSTPEGLAWFKRVFYEMEKMRKTRK